ncbi:MAG: hypothetical protein KGI00_00210 [Candidatus Micrarchaeota archaeon]|nr:hypothetical protein [Candidatus Micrarchaeota archaeon]
MGHQAPVHGRSGLNWPAIAIVAIVIIAIVYFFVSGSGIKTVTSTYNFSMSSSNSVNFRLPGSNSTYSVYLASASPASATFYVGKEPVLINRISVFTLTPGGSVNVSTDGSDPANLVVKLHSSGTNTASVELLHIPTDFNARVSSSVTFLNSSQAAAASTTVTTTVATTTVGVGQGSTTAPTTTVSSSGGSAAQALADANLTAYGTLMNNYKVLYNNGKQCTPGLYNSTMQSKGFSYAGPNSYANISMVTPTDVTSSVAKVSGSTYNVTYVLVKPSGNSNVLVLKLDSSSNTLITYKYGGDFSGLTYGQLNQSYATEAQIGNNCAAYIP